MYLIWIGLLLLIIAVYLKRNKYLYIIQIAYLWFVAANNTWNADYVNYMNGYQFVFDYHGLISEPIYWFLAKISNYIGLDFQGYRYLFFGIAYIVLGVSIWKLAIYPNIIIGLYFLYPFSLDVIQMRSLMANSLVIFAVWKMQLYINNNNTKDLISSIVFVILATGFHYSAIAAAIIYLALISKQTFNRYFPKLVGIATVALAVIVIFRTQISNKFMELGIIEKVTLYQTYDSEIGGYLISVFVLRCIFVLICWLAIHSPGKEFFENKNIIISNNQFLFRSVCVLSLYAFLELFVSMEIERISRVTLILGYVLLTNLSNISQRNNYRIIKGLVVIFVAGYFYIMYFRHFAVSSNWFDYTFIPIFENNLLN